MSDHPLVSKIKKLLAPKGDSMDLFFAAEELRVEADGDAELQALALKAFEVAAERDNPNAALCAGDMILAGHGTDADPDAALVWYERGGDGGNWAAALRACKLHRVHTRDFAKARRFAELAAHDENPEAGAALYQLGLLAFNGQGEPKDDKKAYELHDKAAKKGDADAMFEMYVLLSTGQGVAKDEPAALKWNKKAAELGQHRACYNMGAFHATGRGAKKDMTAAMRWYQRAADAGSGQAAGTLAAMILVEHGPDGAEAALPQIARALELDFDVGGLLVRTGLPEEIVETLIAAAS
jgi:TPR repeat protein